MQEANVHDSGLKTEETPMPGSLTPKEHKTTDVIINVFCVHTGSNYVRLDEPHNPLVVVFGKKASVHSRIPFSRHPVVLHEVLCNSLKAVLDPSYR